MVAKSSKKRKEADFLNDGLSSDDIKNIVQEIILYMTENKNKCSSHEELLNKIKLKCLNLKKKRIESKAFF